MSEVATTQIRRRIRLLPGDLVEQLETGFLHREADRINHVASARDPDRAIRLERGLALRQLAREPNELKMVLTTSPEPAQLQVQRRRKAGALGTSTF